MKATLSRGRGGLYYELTADNGQECIFQSDWDFPGLASSFGFVACVCGETDGTVDCKHFTKSEMISRAADFLDQMEGETIDDPGYFE